MCALLQIKKLLGAKVACAAPQYVVDWLAHPQANLSRHLLFGSRPAAALAHMEAERCKGGDDPEQSCSF